MESSWYSCAPCSHPLGACWASPLFVGVMYSLANVSCCSYPLLLSSGVHLVLGRRLFGKSACGGCASVQRRRGRRTIVKDTYTASVAPLGRCSMVVRQPVTISCGGPGRRCLFEACGLGCGLHLHLKDAHRDLWGASSAQVLCCRGTHAMIKQYSLSTWRATVREESLRYRSVP